MRWLLSSYTLRLNHRHTLFGRVFSGRYKALLVDGSRPGYLNDSGGLNTGQIRRFGFVVFFQVRLLPPTTPFALCGTAGSASIRDMTLIAAVLGLIRPLASARFRPRPLGFFGNPGPAWMLLLPGLLAIAASLPTAGSAAPEPNPSRPLPPAVDLRHRFDEWGLARKRQGARPTCSAFTVTGALEFALAKRQGQGTRLSTEFLNWAANKECGDADDGGFFSDLWKGFAAMASAPKPSCPTAGRFSRPTPRPPRPWRTRKPDSGSACASTGSRNGT